MSNTAFAFQFSAWSLFTELFHHKPSSEMVVPRMLFVPNFLFRIWLWVLVDSRAEWKPHWTTHLYRKPCCWTSGIFNPEAQHVLSRPSHINILSGFASLDLQQLLEVDRNICHTVLKNLLILTLICYETSQCDSILKYTKNTILYRLQSWSVAVKDKVMFPSF